MASTMTMEGEKFHLLSSQTLTNRSQKNTSDNHGVVGAIIHREQRDSTAAAVAPPSTGEEMKKKLIPLSSEKDYKNYNHGFFENASFMRWKAVDVLSLIRCHPMPCIFAASLLFFMGVEYTLRMVPSSSPPFDLGFVVTLPLHRMLASRPNLNSFLAGLNTVINLITFAINFLLGSIRY